MSNLFLWCVLPNKRYYWVISRNYLHSFEHYPIVLFCGLFIDFFANSLLPKFPFRVLKGVQEDGLVGASLLMYG